MTAPHAAAIALAVGAFVLGIVRGTWAVGGSDSSCYALMAQAFAEGELQPRSALLEDAPWPDSALTFAPAGFIPSPVEPDAASPICAPGFSLLLAPFYFFGGRDGIFFLTPLAGGLLVYLTFVLGRATAGGPVGLAAAAVMAATPVFVFQLMQPMNDVTVAMLWTAVMVMVWNQPDRLATIAATGAVAGLAVLVRPNLGPLVLPVAVWCCGRSMRRLAIFGMSAAPFAAILLVFNQVLYGHPLQTGYGNAGELFAVRHVRDNLVNYGTAFWQSQLGFPLLGFLAAAVAPREQRRPVWFGLSAALVVFAIYLLYRPLPEWWYLRFLLPAFPVLTVFALATVTWSTRRAWPLVPVATLVVAYAVSSHGMASALELWRVERRFRTAAAVAQERLPDAAVFLTVWESGSVRYHAERTAVLWDSLPPEALTTAIDWLRARGHEPFIMIEDAEEPQFRSRFSSHSPIGNLDWPPRFEIGRRVKVYRPADRAAFLQGETIPREIVLADRP